MRHLEIVKSASMLEYRLSILLLEFDRDLQHRR
jgi:hypothetical protein